MSDLYSFINNQLSRWPLACGNFRALRNVRLKDMTVGRLPVRAQFNPARIGSAVAKTDKASLEKRPCFLCPEHRPSEQIFQRFEGRKGKKYDILVNPYPIFTDHLVIASRGHIEQTIWRRYVDLLDLSKAFRKFIFFYNGPKCGASAPDHHHFQAAGRGKMPLENDVDLLLDGLQGKVCAGDGDLVGPFGELKYLSSVQDADLYHYQGFTTGVFVLRGTTAKSTAKLFYRLLDCAPIVEGDSEPRFNLFSFYKNGEYRSIVIFRSRHRSHHYFSEGPDHLTMSPGCVDMAGLLIVPREEDFVKLESGILTDMLREVTLTEEDEAMMIWRLTRSQRHLGVGIMSAGEIVFEIKSDGAGPRKAVYRDGKIEYDGALYDELYFGENTLSTMFAEPTFILYGVRIGKNFHWERTENQKFAGALNIIVEDGRLTAVNLVGVEDYLLSVISSEMKASSSLEFLKAHAVISRSWVMAMLGGRDEEPAGEVGSSEASEGASDGGGDEIIRWYGKSQHKNYDVCADDHCQRYQGLTRAVGKTIREAIDGTWGQILTYEGEICDARFSKCCGGVTEKFSVCWEDRDYPYLPALADTPGHAPGHAFCDTTDSSILERVLNSYDLETKDFYRWSVKYGREEISRLVKKNLGRDLGRISAIEPLERGESGRIWRLRVRGEKGSVVLGKELEIRKILSTSHLKSSAFEVEYLGDDGSAVDCLAGGAGTSEAAGDTGAVESVDDWTEIVLHGRGWGHGVGLCQIGAAVMAAEGYDYRQILEHYYPGAELNNSSFKYPNY